MDLDLGPLIRKKGFFGWRRFHSSGLCYDSSPCKLDFQVFIVLQNDGFIDPLRPQYTEILWAQVVLKLLMVLTLTCLQCFSRHTSTFSNQFWCCGCQLEPPWDFSKHCVSESDLVSVRTDSSGHTEGGQSAKPHLKILQLSETQGSVCVLCVQVGVYFIGRSMEQK